MNQRQGKGIYGRDRRTSGRKHRLRGKVTTARLGPLNRVWESRKPGEERPKQGENAE